MLAVSNIPQILYTLTDLNGFTYSFSQSRLKNEQDAALPDLSFYLPGSPPLNSRSCGECGTYSWPALLCLFPPSFSLVIHYRRRGRAKSPSLILPRLLMRIESIHALLQRPVALNTFVPPGNNIRVCPWAYVTNQRLSHCKAWVKCGSHRAQVKSRCGMLGCHAMFWGW